MDRHIQHVCQHLRQNTADLLARLHPHLDEIRAVDGKMFEIEAVSAGDDPRIEPFHLVQGLLLIFPLEGALRQKIGLFHLQKEREKVFPDLDDRFADGRRRQPDLHVVIADQRDDLADRIVVVFEPSQDRPRQ